MLNYTSANLLQSEFYPVQQAVAGGKRLPSLFSTTDERFHASLRRAVSNIFSLSSLLQYEPFVDSTTSEFLKQLQSRYADKEGEEGILDFAKWLQYYAFDVIGEMTYSRRHGFIDEGRDVDGIIEYLCSLFDYVAPVSSDFCQTTKPYSLNKIGQMPMLDSLWLKNPLLGYLNRLGIIDSTFSVVTFAKARMAERTNTETIENGGTNKPPDLLSKFQEASKKHPDIMTPARVLTMAVSMAFAGSETTAISLSAIFYYLLKNPRCYTKLMAELDAAKLEGNLGDHDIVPLAAAQKLTYLDACIKEAFRLHPAAGLPLERIVPAAGLNIAGEHIPGGTIVGCSAWVLHRRAEVFGSEPDTYRPERWIEETEEKLKEMNGTMFQFGMGARTCIGKNISLLEIYKVVPSLLLMFEVRYIYQSP